MDQEQYSLRRLLLEQTPVRKAFSLHVPVFLITQPSVPTGGKIILYQIYPVIKCGRAVLTL